jgi:alpha-amylase
MALKVKRIFITTLAVATFFLAQIPNVAANDKNLPQPKPVARGDQSRESLYFVMLDRFENGDPSNDRGGKSGDSSLTGFDPEDWGYWHGGDLKGLIRRLDYIKNLGFTGIWITPPIKNEVLQVSSTGYHGYWGLDFLGIDPHLGDEEDFDNLIFEAHSRGLKVVLDVVANHSADVINYDSQGKVFIPTGKESAKNPSFLNKITNYHNQGNSTFAGDSIVTGDFYGLDDLATKNPEVIQGFIDIWSYWINRFDIDGLRIDTYKHVDSIFWKSVLPKIKQAAKAKGKKSFPIFGEVADYSPESLAPYMASGEVPSLLDFAFSQQVGNYAAKGSSASKLIDLFNADDLYISKTSSAYGLATFISNHDSGRIGSAIIGDLGENSSIALKRSILAHALLFFLRGGPVVYYGDEKGMTGGGGDKAARQSMFPTKIGRWQREDRIGSQPIGEGSSFDQVNPIELEIRKIQAITSENPAFRNGSQQVRYGDRNVFIVTRFHEGQEYIVAFNNNYESDKSAIFTVGNREGKWNALAGECDLSGSSKIQINIPPTSYCVFKALNPTLQSGLSKVSTPKMAVSELPVPWREVSVSVKGSGYQTVSFYARAKGKKWQLLGTSDRVTFQSPNTAGNLYRSFIRNEDFVGVKDVELIAVVKSSNGKVLRSPISKGSFR